MDGKFGELTEKLNTLIKHTNNVVESPATRNQTRDHLIAAANYSQMLYQLSYSRLDLAFRCFMCMLNYVWPGLKTELRD